MADRSAVVDMLYEKIEMYIEQGESFLSLSEEAKHQPDGILDALVLSVQAENWFVLAKGMIEGSEYFRQCDSYCRKLRERITKSYHKAKTLTEVFFRHLTGKDWSWRG